MRTGVLSIAMRSQATVSLLQLDSPGSRQRLQATPSLSGLSWKPPVIEFPSVHAPVGRQQALRDLAFEIISECSAGLREEASGATLWATKELKSL
jgi:hypothetical protein